VAELCDAREVSRRTLNRLFKSALGMGPATYLRRVRLNRARRALEKRTRSITVSGVALKLGFWHLGRSAEQYNQLFGELPHVTLSRVHRETSEAWAKR
jgi:AraC family transcriptional regulator, ethanolamine operon transcriptional activator